MSRLLLTLLLAAGLVQAQPLPLDGIAHVGFRVSSLERSTAYYTNLLGYQQSFVLKNPAGEVGSAFFKVNDEQYIELTPGLPAGEPIAFTHVAFETPDIEALRRLLAARDVKAPPAAKGNGGNLVSHCKTLRSTASSSCSIRTVRWRPMRAASSSIRAPSRTTCSTSAW